MWAGAEAALMQWGADAKTQAQECGCTGRLQEGR